MRHPTLMCRIFALGEYEEKTEPSFCYPHALVSRQRAVNEYVDGWQKYLELAELLELSLADITQRIATGVYYAAWKQEELKRLVCGLFSQSEKREAVLVLIRAL